MVENKNIKLLWIFWLLFISIRAIPRLFILLFYFILNKDKIFSLIAVPNNIYLSFLIFQSTIVLILIIFSIIKSFRSQLINLSIIFVILQVTLNLYNFFINGFYLPLFDSIIYLIILYFIIKYKKEIIKK